MECISCHQPINPESQFCPHCGSPQQILPSQPVTGADGVMRWTYELSMWKNPSLLITIIKVVVFASMVPVLLVTFLTLERGIGEAARVFFSLSGIILGIMLVLFLVAYMFVALLFGGKYSAAFEMDHQGIRHIQVKQQFKKGQKLAMLTALAGVAAKNPQVAGAGMLAASRDSLYTRFSKVTSIIAHPRRNVIYVNEMLRKNQVYVADEHFEAVLNHLEAHCKGAKVSRK